MDPQAKTFTYKVTRDGVTQELADATDPQARTLESEVSEANVKITYRTDNNKASTNTNGVANPQADQVDDPSSEAEVGGALDQTEHAATAGNDHTTSGSPGLRILCNIGFSLAGPVEGFAGYIRALLYNGRSGDNNA